MDKILIAAAIFLSGCAAAPPRTEGPPPRPAPLVQAEQAFRQGAYLRATQLLTQFIGHDIGSPHLSEAEWLLAQSYLALGRTEAVGELRRYLANYPHGAHAEEARQRLGRIEAGRPPTPSRVIDLTTAAAVPEGFLKSWREAGFTGGLVTASQALRAPLAQKFGEAGLEIWVLMDLQAGGVEPKASNTDEPVEPEASNIGEERWIRLMRRLAAQPIDLVAFVPEILSGNRDGDPQERERFFVLFGERYGTDDRANWHWAGWRSREAARLAARLKETGRSVRPGLRVAMLLPSEAITRPRDTLLYRFQDLLELSRYQFDVYLIQLAPSDRALEVGRRGADLLGPGPEIVLAQSDGDEAAVRHEGFGTLVASQRWLGRLGFPP